MARLRVGQPTRLVSSRHTVLPPAPSPVVAWRLAAVRSSPRPRSARLPPLTAPLARPVSRLRRCATPWCYVNPAQCTDVPAVAIKEQPDIYGTDGDHLHWSYVACDRNFGGNSWVGMPSPPPHPPQMPNVG